MKSATPIAALLCSVAALFLALWILVPAPLHFLWLIAVLSSEWSLHIGLVALVGVLLGIAALRGKWKRLGALAIGCGITALALAAYPPIATLSVAGLNAVDLSLARYAIASSESTTSGVQTVDYAEALQLDVYRPGGMDPAVRYPAVVVVHGGSWRSGRRSDFPRWNAWLAAQGFAVFDIDYRIAPQPNWRTASDDVRTAVRWIQSHADSFGVDPERMALLGRSAGGHLALLAAYTMDSTQVRAVISFYAPTDLAWGYEHPANPRVMDGPATLRMFTGGTPEGIPDIYAEASPMRHVHSGMTATLLVHGEQDQIVRSEHTSRLFEALQRVSRGERRHQALFIPYAQHGFDYNFNGWGSQVTQAVLLDFLNRHLNGDGE